MAGADVLRQDLDEAISPRQPAPSIEQALPLVVPAPNSLNHIDMRADPDAQATVSDFLDFTEYLPADIARSLTLIGDLDQTYVDASATVHDLTTLWGELPSRSHAAKTSAIELRGNISENLHHAVNSRVYSLAEAQRMTENVNRHHVRAKTILAKLEAMLNNYPTPEDQKSPVATKSPQLSRAPKLGLRIDGQKVRRPRVPRITVPGEVLAPYDLNYDAYTTGSESTSGAEDEETERLSSRLTPAPPTRIKVVKSTSRTPKPARPPRPRASVPPPNQTGTGFSTSAAIAQLPGPPENVIVGGPDAPWGQLTAYELARLRKRMKKNAAWTPSDTMVARELKALGRGVDAFRAAKQKAEEEGRAFDEEAEESARRFDAFARTLMSDPSQANAQGQSQAAPKAKAQRKRKRDSAPEAEIEKLETAEGQPQRPQLKRTKTETPVPPPILTPGGSQLPLETPTQFSQRVLPGNVPQSTTPIPLPIPGQDQSITAKSGSVPAPRNNTNSKRAAAAQVTTRSLSRSSSPAVHPKPEPDTTTTIMTRRPASRGKTTSAEPSLAADRPRRASTARNTPVPGESSLLPHPSATTATSAGTTSLPTHPAIAVGPTAAGATTNTTTAGRQTGKQRAKRPAPGIISRTNSGGNSAVGKRKAAPRKKTAGGAAAARKAKAVAAAAAVPVPAAGDGVGAGVG
ncbi:hypothetical protein N0V88_005951 [Collariella sp. IMI 366227]|nr:hypothetical protein N0V88_005951 [Collariella sp. IMI 366227]